MSSYIRAAAASTSSIRSTDSHASSSRTSSESDAWSIATDSTTNTTIESFAEDDLIFLAAECAQSSRRGASAKRNRAIQELPSEREFNRSILSNQLGIRVSATGHEARHNRARRPRFASREWAEPTEPTRATAVGSTSDVEPAASLELKLDELKYTLRGGLLLPGVVPVLMGSMGSHEPVKGSRRWYCPVAPVRKLGARLGLNKKSDEVKLSATLQFKPRGDSC